MFSSKKSLQSLAGIMAQKGMANVIISPGSRNSAINIALENHDFFNCRNIIDERSAAFVALGMAQKTGKASAVVCTSGSAVANYYPAVAEAFYQRIPLVVITADRPKEWIDQGDGQTIRQENIFENHCKCSVTLNEDFNDKDIIAYNEYLINKALNAAISGAAGPVHINIPLREPLYETVENCEVPLKNIELSEAIKTLSAENVVEINKEFSAAKKVLILCAMLPKNELLEKELERLSHLPQVLILTETSSNLSFERKISCIDRLITPWGDEEKKNFKPDILISFGHSLVSKRMKSLLRNYRPEEHWHIDLSENSTDTFQSLTRHFQLKDEDFASVLNGTKDSNYASTYLNLDDSRRKQAENFLANAPYSDLKIFEHLCLKAKDYPFVQMGNSSVVRYFQLFDALPDCIYNGNRGASGIDGCSSTAVGAALCSSEDTLLVSGDISFLYDSNAFWNSELPNNLKVVVINNGGGGIFRIIDGPEKSGLLEKHFETSHARDCKKLAEHFGLEYFSANNEKELSQGLKELKSTNKCSVLEVFSPREENDIILKNFFSNLKD